MPIQVAGAVEVLVLVEGDLLENIVFPCHSLLLLKQKVVS